MPENINPLNQVSDKEERERFFALAIAHQKNGETKEARISAGKCLALLEGLGRRETLEEVAAGQVVQQNGQTVCLPDYLHMRTALERFRAEGIAI